MTVEKWKRVDKDIDETLAGQRCFKLRPAGFPTVLTDDELKRLRMPVLYLVGSREGVCAVPRAVKRLEKVAPHITIDVLPGAGHTFWGYDDEVTGRVLAFLDAR